MEKTIDELIQEAEATLGRLQAQKYNEKEKERKELLLEAKEIVNNPLNFEFRVSLPDVKKFHRPDSVFVERKLKDEFVKRCKYESFYTLRLPVDPLHIHWYGNSYYRTEEDILVTGYGHTSVLKTPKLCNGEEWARILRNDIPEKFLIFPSM
jgi:hypothetical protein